MQSPSFHWLLGNIFKPSLLVYSKGPDNDTSWTQLCISHNDMEMGTHLGIAAIEYENKDCLPTLIIIKITIAFL